MSVVSYDTAGYTGTDRITRLMYTLYTCIDHTACSVDSYTFAR